MILKEMCGGVVEDAKFLFIFVRVSAAGRALPATLAWWILWRWVNYSSLCRGVNGNRECSIFGKIECSVFRNSSTSFSVTMMQHFL